MIEKGIIFDNIHSYSDLHLILSKVEIKPAKPKTSYIDIAGGDGSLDLTEAHGEVKYSDRDCKFTFTMHPEYGLTDEDFEVKKTEISNLLSGKRFKITLDKDPDYYYLGRCTVDDFLSNKRIRQIVVTAKVYPYKYKQKETIVRFNLNADEETVILKNGRKSVVPIIVCTTKDAVIKFGDGVYTLSQGTNKILDICLVEGNNYLTISSTLGGIIAFSYQEADL